MFFYVVKFITEVESSSDLSMMSFSKASSIDKKNSDVFVIISEIYN